MPTAQLNPFPPVDEATWRERVVKDMKGRSADSYGSTTADGVRVEALYSGSREPAAPYAPSKERVRAARYDDGDPVAFIAEDQRRGVRLADLRVNDPSMTVERLAAQIEAAERARVGGDVDPIGAAILGLAADDFACVSVDVLGALARTGSTPAELGSVWEMTAALMRYGAANDRRIVLTLSDAPYHDGGADAPTAVGALLANAVATIRALHAHGIPVADVVHAITFEVSIARELFSELAKIRALRWTWGVMRDRFKAPGAAYIVARSARRHRTRRDPWVNMLRGTVEAFVGAVGGADEIQVAPFDASLHTHTGLGRRVAANTSAVLLMESHLDAVEDPAAGSAYIEHLTERLAHGAWEKMQSLEGHGGLPIVLEDGSLVEELEAAWHERLARVRRRKEPVLGVSLYPNLTEAEVAAEPRPTVPVESAPVVVVSAPSATADERLSQALDAAHEGADLATITLAWVPQREVAFSVTPMPVVALAAPFESLRARAEALGAPRARLLGVGPLPKIKARATWTRAAVEASGVHVFGAEVALEGADAAVAAYREDPTDVVVVAAPDADYPSLLPSLAPALAAAGAKAIVVAGHPRESREAYEATGVTHFVYAGADLAGLGEALLSLLESAS